MKDYEAQVLSLVAQRGAIRAREAMEQGIPSMVLARMVMAGTLARPTRGVYALPASLFSGQRDLVDVAVRIPTGVLCLLTALRHYQIGTQSPREVWVALPRSTPPPRIAHPPTRYVWMSPSSIAAGVEHVVLDGVTVSMFGAAKTVVDCFKYRNKLGLDVAIEALTEAWRQDIVTFDELWTFAKIDRVANVMRPYLEAIAT